MLLLVTAAMANPWPTLSPVPTSNRAPQDAAVVVAIEDFAYLADIDGAIENASSWHDWLTKHRGVPPGRVSFLTDADATSDAVEQAVRTRASEVGEGGRLWVVYIGHGTPHPSGTDGLLPGPDAQQKAAGFEERSLRRSTLVEAASKADDAVIVLDACFSGQSAQGYLVPDLMFTIPTTYLASRSEVSVLAAGTSAQFAGPLPGLGRPAFSYLVLGAMRGWGDQDEDGTVTAGEAVRYASNTLSLLEEQTGRAQTPTLDGPDRPLAAGSEPGPDVVELAIGNTSELVLDIDEATYIADLEERQQALVEQESARARRIEETRRSLVAESSTEWAALERSIPSVEGFLDRWRGRKVRLDGVTYGFDLPVVEQAEATLVELYREDLARQRRRVEQQAASIEAQSRDSAEEATRAWAQIEPTLNGDATDLPVLTRFVSHHSGVAAAGATRVRIDSPAVEDARIRIDQAMATVQPPEHFAAEAIFRARHQAAVYDSRRAGGRVAVAVVGSAALWATSGAIIYDRVRQDDPVSAIPAFLISIPSVMFLGMADWKGLKRARRRARAAREELERAQTQRDEP